MGASEIHQHKSATAGYQQHDNVNKSDGKLLYDTRSQQEEWTTKRN